MFVGYIRWDNISSSNFGITTGAKNYIKSEVLYKLHNGVKSNFLLLLHEAAIRVYGIYRVP